MELEIANYLNQVSEGRLSSESKLQIRAMLREVTEIESIGDSCYNLARTINRKRQANLEFTEKQYEHIHFMMKLTDDALGQMIVVVERSDHQGIDVNKSFNIENEINNYRNQLKNQNILDVNNKEYDYQMGVYYMDIIAECEKLLYISNTDALTGCLNRHAYETDINKLDLKKEWIYISLDLNSLKHINDTYGHDVGDEMICAAAACMTASFGEFGKVYRIGGDEFVVIVTQKPDELDAMTKHFDSSVAEWRGKIVDSMTISYGCVRSLEEDWELVHDIEKEADRRMYASKARYYSDSGIDRRK